MANDETYEIRHPETLLVGRMSVRLYTNLDDDPAKPAQWHDNSLMLMAMLEPMDLSAKTAKR
jgi:hypothetical protein